MYLALSFFRLASIVQGVVARFHQVKMLPQLNHYICGACHKSMDLVDASVCRATPPALLTLKVTRSQTPILFLSCVVT